jgi:hypothetical protein
MRDPLAAQLGRTGWPQGFLSSAALRASAAPPRACELRAASASSSPIRGTRHPAAVACKF